MVNEGDHLCGSLHEMPGGPRRGWGCQRLQEQPKVGASHPGSSLPGCPTNHLAIVLALVKKKAKEAGVKKKEKEQEKVESRRQQHGQPPDHGPRLGAAWLSLCPAGPSVGPPVAEPGPRVQTDRYCIYHVLFFVSYWIPFLFTAGRRKTGQRGQRRGWQRMPPRGGLWIGEKQVLWQEG